MVPQTDGCPVPTHDAPSHPSLPFYLSPSDRPPSFSRLAYRWTHSVLGELTLVPVSLSRGTGSGEKGVFRSPFC